MKEAMFETRRALLLRSWKKKKRTKKEDVFRFLMTKRQRAGIFVRYFMIKKWEAGVFRSPVSYEQGTPVTPLLA